MKRKAMSCETENDGPAGKENKMWLQCDRCKYTTHYNAFMVHHVRGHKEEDGGGGASRLPTITERCDENGAITTEAQEAEADPIPSEEIKKDMSETMEMIAAEISGEGETETGEADERVEANATCEGKQVTLQAVEGEDGNNTICMVDENGIIVQKVEQAEDGTLYVQMADNADPTKQVKEIIVIIMLYLYY